MLTLDSPRWSELRHAYGSAEDIPSLLRALESLPNDDGTKEPWFSLWSALAHQGDVYSASFAAVPHVVRILSNDPTHAHSSYFQFPAWVEICRINQNVSIPSDLQDAYQAALARLPEIVAVAAQMEWDDSQLACALAAIAAAKGFAQVGEAVLELNSTVAREFLDWHFSK